VRSGEQITRHGAALSTYRGNEPADQIGWSVLAPYVKKWSRGVTYLVADRPGGRRLGNHP